MTNRQLPDWWPPNPYPADIFTATIKDYKLAIPDETLRTAISGVLGRYFWDIASSIIFSAMQNQTEITGSGEPVLYAPKGSYDAD